MDELDLDIISLLQRNGRMAFTDIAKEVGVSEGTVRNRLSQLLDDQTIQIVGMADPLKLGYDAPAVIAVSVQPQMLDEVAKKIADLPQVSYLIMVSGEYDLMVEVMCKDRDDLAALLNKQIRGLEGVTRTQTFFILHTYKMAFGALPVIPDRNRDQD